MSRPLSSRPSRSATSATVLHVDFATGRVVDRVSTSTRTSEMLLSEMAADIEKLQATAVAAVPASNNPFTRLLCRNFSSLCHVLLGTLGDMRLTMQREGVVEVKLLKKPKRVSASGANTR